MARLLFLDDSLERHDDFAKRTRGHYACRVFTARSAKEFLSDGNFDGVFLDRDLGGPPFGQDVHGGTGEDVADFMATRLPKELRPKKVVIHSQNKSAAERMRKTLVQAGYKRVVLAPFLTDMDLEL